MADAPSRFGPETDRTPPLLPQYLRNPSDAEAWRTFEERYTPMILRWARDCGLPEEDARDCAQEVMLRILRAIQTFNYDPARGSFRGWLKTITRSAAFDFQRSRQAERLRQIAGDVPESAALEQVFEQIVARELHQIGLETLKNLAGERDYELFRLKVFEEITAEELSQRYGLAIGSVFRIISQTQAAYRQILRQLDDNLPEEEATR